MMALLGRLSLLNNDHLLTQHHRPHFNAPRPVHGLRGAEPALTVRPRNGGLQGYRRGGAVLGAIQSAGAYSEVGIVPLHRGLCIDKYQPYC